MASDDVTCQYCRRELGNAGARANHERSCDENPANQQRERAPARREPQQQGELAQADGPAGPGAELADLGIALLDDDVAPEQRGQALGGLLGLAQQGVNRYNQYRQAKMEEQERRAQQVELEKVTELPECECGYQFDADEIGLNDERVRCPDCNALWRLGVEQQA